MRKIRVSGSRHPKGQATAPPSGEELLELDHIAFHHPETLATQGRNIIFFLSANRALERHVTPRPNESPTAPRNFQLSGK